MVEPECPVDVGAVASAFALDAPLTVSAYHPGSGGAWQLRNSRGEFALKCTPVAPSEWWLAQLERQGRLETLASSVGVRIATPVLPVAPSVGAAAEVEGRLVWLHEWVVAATHSVDVPRWLGETLAALHAVEELDRSRDAELRHAYGLHSSEDWLAWVSEGRAQRQAWTDCIDIDLIRATSAGIEELLAEQTVVRCFTHRDVSPENVLSSAEGPVLSDFSYAGVDIGWAEAVSCAVAFRAPQVLRHYLDAGGSAGPRGEVALGRSAGALLQYLGSRCGSPSAIGGTMRENGRSPPNAF